MKICTIVWKSASSFQHVNQLPPPSLARLFDLVIEVTSQASKISVCIFYGIPSSAGENRVGIGHGLRFAGVPWVI